jgi:hypothetical protein
VKLLRRKRNICSNRKRSVLPWRRVSKTRRRQEEMFQVKFLIISWWRRRDRSRRRKLRRRQGNRLRIKKFRNVLRGDKVRLEPVDMDNCFSVANLEFNVTITFELGDAMRTCPFRC